MNDTLNKLLAVDLPEPETKQIKMTRLSKLAGEDVVFTIKELSYNKMVTLANMAVDGELNMVLDMVAEPDLRDPRLWQDKLGCATPVDGVKKLLRPGEIRALVREEDYLTGFRGLVLEDVAKN